MIFFVLILLLFMFSAVKTAPENTFHQDYLSRENTYPVKGIFVILILFSHGVTYITLEGVYDAPYIALKNHLSQMVVAMFLFYSGYGIMEQIRLRRWPYIRSILSKRFPQVLLHFDIAVVFFLLTDLVLKRPVTAAQFLIALTAWSSIGNSDWYIFVILCLYLLCFLSFIPLRYNGGKRIECVCLTLLTVLSVLFVYLQMVIGRPRYTFNTVILFVLGAWYSWLKKPVESIVMRNDLCYSIAGCLLLLGYAFFYFRRGKGIEEYSVWAVCFTMLCVLLTMKVSFRSELLMWFGRHTFSIYIIQRIPMLVLSRIPFFAHHRYVFLVCSWAAAIPSALMLEYITGRLDGLIWRAKSEQK